MSNEVKSWKEAKRAAQYFKYINAPPSRAEIKHMLESAERRDSSLALAQELLTEYLVLFGLRPRWTWRPPFVRYILPIDHFRAFLDERVEQIKAQSKENAT